MLFFARADGRVMFLVPAAGHTLLGTTEVDGGTDPGENLPPEDEVRYLLREGQAALPGAELTPARALGLTTGVRPLVRGGQASLGALSREHRIVTEGPLVSAVGGKYTTFRPMCADVARVVSGLLGRARPRDDESPLPGGEIPGRFGGDFVRFLQEEQSRLAPTYPKAAAELPRLIRAHGARAARVLERDPEGARPLLPGVPALGAEVRYAVEVEKARTLDDVMRRRTALWLSRDFGRPAAAAVAERMAELLAWSADRTRDELAGWWRFSSGEEHVLHRVAETP
jgi:glycerol-3-phosphate dehydrogenase